MKQSEMLLDNELMLSNHARFLKKHGLFSAALFYKNLNETVARRGARAGRYVLEHLGFPEYKDGQPFMSGYADFMYSKAPEDDANGYGLYYRADGGVEFDEEKFKRLYEKCENRVEKYIVGAVIADCNAARGNISRCRYNHGGTHNVIDIERLLHEGLAFYRGRIERELEGADSEKRLFEEGLLDMLDGYEDYIARFVADLEEKYENYTGDKETLGRLINALRKVPLQPAESFYEAYVSCSAGMYLSACFEPGRLDHYLYPYYEKDLAEGKTTPEEAYHLIRVLFEEMDSQCGHPGAWHVTIGGTNADGTASYNALTEICVRAISGLRQPNVTLRIRRDMPDALWKQLLENIAKGDAQPAIVNEELFLEKLTADYDIPYCDAVNYVFGGCSEVLIQGKTMCDSTWVQYVMLDVFEQALYNHFLTCDTFEAFYEKVKAEIALTVRDMETQINVRQLAEGLHLPQMVRSLFVDGCIQNGKGFGAGGAVYNFDSTNLYSTSNTINALYTVKQYYEGKLGDFSKETFLQALIADFEGYEAIHAKCKNVTKFGNYDPKLNKLANDLMEFTFDRVMELRCWRRNDGYVGRYMPAIILWVDWISSGYRVGATPDGRKAGEATADCCGPMQGTDTEGPTSVMGAALSLNQGKCAGTCVLNLRLDKANFKTEEAAAKVRKLIEVYFMQGGSQLQINVVDPAVLLDALDHPEKHKDIIVRVGGFSDNFVMLDKAMQMEIIKRTEYTV